jgi:hypothetical protein
VSGEASGAGERGQESQQARREAFWSAVSIVRDVVWVGQRAMGCVPLRAVLHVAGSMGVQEQTTRGALELLEWSSEVFRPGGPGGGYRLVGSGREWS